MLVVKVVNHYQPAHCTCDSPSLTWAVQSINKIETTETFSLLDINIDDLQFANCDRFRTLITQNKSKKSFYEFFIVQFKLKTKMNSRK